MWKVTVNTTGMATTIKAYEKALRKEAELESAKVNGRFEKHLRRNVPVDSGDLASTIKIFNISDGANFGSGTSIGDDSQAIYAAPLEFGHTLKGRHIPGKRFWTPLKTIYNKRWKAAMRRAVKRAWQSVAP